MTEHFCLIYSTRTEFGVWEYNVLGGPVTYTQKNKVLKPSNDAGCSNYTRKNKVFSNINPFTPIELY